jgi:hypothetical protein
MPTLASPLLMEPGNQEWPWHVRPESGMDGQGNTVPAGTAGSHEFVVQTRGQERAERRAWAGETPHEPGFAISRAMTRPDDSGLLFQPPACSCRN